MVRFCSMYKYRDVIGIRCHQWSSAEEFLYKSLLHYFKNEQIFFVMDETKQKTDIPDHLNKISLNESFLQNSKVLDRHPNPRGLGWLCGDYFYYALASHINSQFYWLVEPDLWFTFDNTSIFFQAFECMEEDSLLQSFQPAADIWSWKKHAQLVHPNAYKSFFPISRLSRKAVLACLKARQKLYDELQAGKFTVDLYPNDEGLVGTVVANDPSLTNSSLSVAWRNSFKYCTYMSIIPSYPHAKNLLPSNQVVHPARDIDYISSMIADNIKKTLQKSNEIKNLMSKFIIPDEQLDILQGLVESKLSSIYSDLYVENSYKLKLKTLIDTTLEDFDRLLPLSRTWVWKENTFVIDIYSGNDLFACEYQLTDVEIICNIFTRRSETCLAKLIYTNMELGRLISNGEKVEIFRQHVKDANLELAIKSSMAVFQKALTDAQLI